MPVADFEVKYGLRRRIVAAELNGVVGEHQLIP